MKIESMKYLETLNHKLKICFSFGMDCDTSPRSLTVLVNCSFKNCTICEAVSIIQVFFRGLLGAYSLETS